MFYYSRDRSGEHPQGHLAGYRGILQADAYGGYNKLYDAGRKPGPIMEAACWAHARRKFFVLADLGPERAAQGAGKKASASRRWRSRPCAASTRCSRSSAPSTARRRPRRLAVRRELSAPLVADLEAWMREQRARLSRQHDVAKAIDYMLKRWPLHALPR